jgi:hypothetical protein
VLWFRSVEHIDEYGGPDAEFREERVDGFAGGEFVPAQGEPQQLHRLRALCYGAELEEAGEIPEAGPQFFALSW